MTASGPNATPQAPGNLPLRYADAAGRIRDSAKYLLGAFAAVGAILAAGLQLTSIGALTADRADHRLQWAIAAVATAVLGIALAIGSATTVISRSFVTLRWLSQRTSRAKKLNGDTALLASFSTVAELSSAFTHALEIQSCVPDSGVTR